MIIITDISFQVPMTQIYIKIANVALRDTFILFNKVLALVFFEFSLHKSWLYWAVFPSHFTFSLSQPLLCKMLLAGTSIWTPLLSLILADSIMREGVRNSLTITLSRGMILTQFIYFLRALRASEDKLKEPSEKVFSWSTLTRLWMIKWLNSMPFSSITSN